MLPDVDEVDSHGKLFDSEDEKQSGFFGIDHNEEMNKSRDSQEAPKFQASNDGDDMFQYLQNVKKAPKKRRETASVGGANYFQQKNRSKSPNERVTRSS